MDPVKVAFAANAINFGMKYGFPAAQKIIAELANKEDPTMEDIEALDDFLKEPDSYFEEE